MDLLKCLHLKMIQKPRSNNLFEGSLGMVMGSPMYSPMDWLKYWHLDSEKPMGLKRLKPMDFEMPMGLGKYWPMGFDLLKRSRLGLGKYWPMGLKKYSLMGFGLPTQRHLDSEKPMGLKRPKRIYWPIPMRLAIGKLKGSEKPKPRYFVIRSHLLKDLPK